jgi:hypothetical protein
MREKYRVSGFKIQNYMYLHIFTKYLKVLSSEIDPVEIRLIRKVFIKDRVSEKSVRPPSCESSLKRLSHEIDFKNFDKNLHNLTLLRDAVGFLIF